VVGALLILHDLSVAAAHTIHICDDRTSFRPVVND